MQPNEANDIKLMQPGGYFVTMTYVRDFGGWDFHRVAVLDGSRTLLAHADVGCQYGAILPSPDGKQIAYFDVAGHCNDGGSGNDVVVTFFDGTNGQKQATSASVPLPGGAYETWTPAGDLILTDLSKSVRVWVDGTTAPIAAAPVPRCTEPGTTSSAERGRRAHARDREQPAGGGGDDAVGRVRLPVAAPSPPGRVRAGASG
jgi:hypothetical protein